MARRHVTPNPNGGWNVRTPGAKQPNSHHRTQAAAERRAKQEVKREGGGEVVIHSTDGRIRDADTVKPGHDPNPPTDVRH